MRRKQAFQQIFIVVFLFFACAVPALAQPDEEKNKKNKKTEDARPVTIPIAVRAGEVLTGGNRGEIIDAGNLTIKENGEVRQILSVRSTSASPLHFAVLIQEDVATSVNLELKGLADFIRRLPKGSRVMIGYLRAGTLLVRQKFTDDLEKAADSFRVIPGTSAVAPLNPYVGIIEALERFDNLPMGRRAMLVVSDGLDVSNGVANAAPSQSIDLDRAILKAQRNGTAIYGIYASTDATSRSSVLVSYAQGSLNRLTEDTGGRSFFQGSSTPVSFAPYLRELGLILSRQFALTYLSTGSKNRPRKIEVTSDNSEIKIEHPKNYVPKN